MAIRTDLLLRKLFAFLDKQVGMKDVLVVFTADHGVAPLPEVSKQRKLEAGRYPAGAVEKPVEAALESQVRRRASGSRKWLTAGRMLYLNLALIHEKNLDRAEVDRVAAELPGPFPHFPRLHPRTDHERPDRLRHLRPRGANGFFPPRGADVVVIQEPYWLFGATGTSHGTPFGYDTHVPVIFMGPGIKAGKYYDSIAVNDIAPTLATLLSVEIPSGAAGGYWRRCSRKT